MSRTIFFIIVGIIVFNYIVERILDYLNSIKWTNKLPEELKGIYDAEKYRKSQEYLRGGSPPLVLVNEMAASANVVLSVVENRATGSANISRRFVAMVVPRGFASCKVTVWLPAVAKTTSGLLADTIRPSSKLQV